MQTSPDAGTASGFFAGTVKIDNVATTGPNGPSTT